jgi:hypothetical protein
MLLTKLSVIVNFVALRAGNRQKNGTPSRLFGVTLPTAARFI